MLQRGHLPRRPLVPAPPPHFAAERASLIALIQTHPLGALIRRHEDALEADHLPFLIEERGDTLHLLAHVARANPLWQQAEAARCW